MSKHCNFICLKIDFHLHTFCNANKKELQIFKLFGRTPNYMQALIFYNYQYFQKHIFIS